MSDNTFKIEKDVASKKVTVFRSFDAPLADVWKAWTNSEILDQWWAPKPWKAETRQQDFKVGGYWLYAMVGPEGEKHWSRVDYLKIDPMKSFEAKDCFCDENGTPVNDLPNMHWLNEFKEAGDKTNVIVHINFASEEALQKIIEMGFEQGFQMGLQNLDEYFAKQ